MTVRSIMAVCTSAKAAARSCAVPIAAALAAACDEAAPRSDSVAALQEMVANRTEAASQATSPGGRIIRESAPYLGKITALEEPEAQLPARLEGPSGFAWTTGAPIPPGEIAARVTRATGIPVVLDFGLPETRTRIIESAGAIRYRGPLSGFLDVLGSQWDTGWTYRNGVVRIVDRIFKAYPVRASVAQSSLSLETADSGTESGSLDTGVRLESAAWEEIETNLQGIVDRGSFSLSPSAGLVSVTAPPSVHEAVSEYLSRANEVFDTRISIEVAAAFLDVTDLDNYGLSLTFLASLLDEDVSMRLGRDSASQAPGIASVTILESATGGLARHVGTTAMLHALSRTNRIIDYRTANAITRHGSPVPIRLSRRRDIVRRVSVTVEGDTSTTAVESETLDTGLSISAHPRLVDPGKVHLTLSVSASDLVSLVPFQAGENNTVQLATVDERRLTHDFVIGSNELVILAGYEQRRAGRLGEGIGRPDFFLLGGSRTSDDLQSRLYLFVHRARNPMSGMPIAEQHGRSGTRTLPQVAAPATGKDTAGSPVPNPRAAGTRFALAAVAQQRSYAFAWQGRVYAFGGTWFAFQNPNRRVIREALKRASATHWTQMPCHNATHVGAFRLPGERGRILSAVEAAQARFGSDFIGAFELGCDSLSRAWWVVAVADGAVLFDSVFDDLEDARAAYRGLLVPEREFGVQVAPREFAPGTRFGRLRSTSSWISPMSRCDGTHHVGFPRYWRWLPSCYLAAHLPQCN